MSSNHEIKMWTPMTLVMVLFVLIASAIALYRMVNGLGAATNMNDGYPWGIWLGFDLYGGVAMAGGGFTIAAAIYIFNWKKYKPIGRPAILTAFLGYLLAVIALFFDIGHPFRLWHPSIMWQVHSIMWVVAIHVILYTTTLAIESSPMFFEKFKMPKVLKFLNRYMVWAVIFGCMLSTLHQASLGAVFLIAPSKMSPLWFVGSFMPYMFLISAIAMGLAMVSTESMISCRAFNHKIDDEIFFGLARGLLTTLIIYLIVKVYYLITTNSLGLVFNGSMPSMMFLLEMAIGIIIPLVFLLNKKVRTNLRGIAAVNWLVIIGVLVNRMNACLFSFDQYNTSVVGAGYFPSAMELLFTLGLISLGVVLFKMAAKYLPLFKY
ncbi:MAG: Ni/Fe-hydrogenase cytochrome b subunit [Thermodesulfobacteriota bacterium]|nr:Ni/Fe-hydrogenase cytochrome b subunit [Thermodesulfobacteriota bacterium]